MNTFPIDITEVLQQEAAVKTYDGTDLVITRICGA